MRDECFFDDPMSHEVIVWFCSGNMMNSCRARDKSQGVRKQRG